MQRSAILVVDDNRQAREGVVELLDRDGFVSIPACNGEEALDYLRAGGSADVIVLDLDMPEMDGWTFRRQQRSDPKFAHIPVVVMSALERSHRDPVCADATLEKPVDPHRLVSIVRALAGRQEDPDEGSLSDPDL